MRPWGSDFFDHMGKHVDAFQGLPPHIHRALVTAYIEGALVNELTADDFHGLVGPWLTESGAPRFYRQFAQADEKYTAEVEPLLGKIRCPAKIVWGKDDPWIPLERGRSLHELMPDADFVTIPSVGHLPQLENPESAIEQMRIFF
jgi:pimeloyl-ACP methyl ester carboxylesterase